MNDAIGVTPHQDSWINQSYGYVSKVLDELSPHRRVLDGWIDPAGPRDGTIMFIDPTTSAVHALVWDEETGWRTGRFVTGRQGERTVLHTAVHLGGGLLPEPGEVVRRLLSGVSEPRRQYRSHADLTDGFDATLRGAYAPAPTAV